MTMRTNFEKIDVSQWPSVQDLVGILAELNVVATAYRSVEIPVPDHFSLKEEEIKAAIKTLYRVDMLKQTLMLEQELKSLRTDKEKRADIKDRITSLKTRLGLDIPKGIEAGQTAEQRSDDEPQTVRGQQ